MIDDTILVKPSELRVGDVYLDEKGRRIVIRNVTPYRSGLARRYAIGAYFEDEGTDRSGWAFVATRSLEIVERGVLT